MCFKIGSAKSSSIRLEHLPDCHRNLASGSQKKCQSRDNHRTNRKSLRGIGMRILERREQLRQSPLLHNLHASVPISQADLTFSLVRSANDSGLNCVSVTKSNHLVYQCSWHSL